MFSKSLFPPKFVNDPMRMVLFLILICLANTGCQVSPRAEREIALLRAEILDLEDHYFAVKSQRDSAVTQLRDCKGDDFDASRFNDPLSMDDSCIVYTPDSVTWGEPTFAVEQDSNSGSGVFRTPPAFDRKPIGNGAGSRLESESRYEEVSPEGAFNSAEANRNYANSNSRMDANSPVSEIVISRSWSGGQDLDGLPGHEGLELLIQPLDRFGQVKKQTGQLTVRIVEPLTDDSDRQVGLWQFTPRESESFLVRDGESEQGILLHLPWNGQLPKSRRLTVFVSFLTRDQRNLQTVSKFNIEVPADIYSASDPVIARWIEQDSRWNDLEVSDGMMNAMPGSSNQENSENLVPDQSATTENGISTPRWRPVR